MAKKTSISGRFPITFGLKFSSHHENIPKHAISPGLVHRRPAKYQHHYLFGHQYLTPWSALNF
jgi:hypothetical protein